MPILLDISERRGESEVLMNTKEIMVTCRDCGKEISINDAIKYGNEYICPDCFESDYVRCQLCGEIFVECDSTTLNPHTNEERIICSQCASSYNICTHCNGVYDNNYIWASDSNYTICQYCSRRYFICDECERIENEDHMYRLDDDNDGYYCYDCYSELRNSRYIHEYSYKASPLTFYGTSNLFIGVEIEIDKGGMCDENAKELLDLVNEDDEYFICKRDGSLEAGLEFVSMPCDLQTHTNVINYKGFFEKAISLGYRGHQCQTAGLHCHVNRNAFGNTIEEQEEVIARIVFFVENHWNELLKFSRRTIENIERWASRYGISENTQDTYRKAKGKNMGRYAAVNLVNFSTIEFRLWRSTLRYGTFIATLQLVDEICHTCMNMNDEELEALSWSSFVLGIKEDKSELIGYLKSKQLYVNELVEETEEM